MLAESSAKLVEIMRAQPRTVVFSGAGISTESGIPDFRSPGGIWSRYRPVYFQEFLADPAARYESWRQKSEAYEQFADAKPNAGHVVLARWEAQGRLAGVITQNIDGLHQAAGSRKVWEIHGTAREIECLACRQRFDPAPLIEQFRREDQVPCCKHCGGFLKSATVSFGQELPEDVLEQSVTLCREAELMIVVGSSLVVEPAAGLPRVARQYGARLVIINRDPTAQDAAADLVINRSIGETLAEVDSALAEN